MNYQFKDQEFADAVQRHRTMLNNLQATLDDMAVARAGLEASINECDDPATKAKLYKDVVALANMTTKTSKELVELQFRLNEVLGKEALYKLSDALCKAITDTVRKYVDARTYEQVVDELSPTIVEIIAQARN